MVAGATSFSSGIFFLNVVFMYSVYPPLRANQAEPCYLSRKIQMSFTAIIALQKNYSKTIKAPQARKRNDSALVLQHVTNEKRKSQENKKGENASEKRLA